MIALPSAVIGLATAVLSGMSILSGQVMAATADPAPAGQPAPTPGATPAPQFAIVEYVVDGNSLLAEDVIELAVSPFLGEAKTLRDVDGARAALEKKYHDAGYLTVMVSIPEQRVDSGEVALHVVEAGIDRLRVKGAEFTLPSGIKARIPELAEGKVPNFNIVQQQLTALNRSADIKVTPVLRAGKLPGTVEVQLDAEDQLPVHGNVEYSNRQTPNTSAQRLSANLRYDNLWQRGHSFGLTLQTAPSRPRDARVAVGTYVMPVGDNGNALSLFAVSSRSDFASLANAPGLGLLGNSDTLGLRYMLAFGGDASFTHNASVGFDRKRIGQTLIVLGGAGTNASISYMPVVTTYTARKASAQRITVFDAGITAGLRGLGGNEDVKFNAKRESASASFIALRAGVQLTEELGKWSMFGKLDAQLASGPLVPSEQYVAGGAESVRGYLEGERAADNGVHATFELRTPRYNPGHGDWRIGGLLFFDTARLTILQPRFPQPAHEQLGGAGVGLRIGVPHGVSFELDAARALTDGDTTRNGDKRVHARAIWGF